MRRRRPGGWPRSPPTCARIPAPLTPTRFVNTLPLLFPLAPALSASPESPAVLREERRWRFDWIRLRRRLLFLLPTPRCEFGVLGEPCSDQPQKGQGALLISFATAKAHRARPHESWDLGVKGRSFWSGVPEFAVTLHVY
jgi:hypothetical protein